jgi:hypothetical protein
MSARTRAKKREKPPKPERVSGVHEFFTATVVWAIVVFAFVYYAEWIGIIAVSCIYIAWQQSVATHLPGRPGEISRAFRDSPAGRAWGMLVVGTLIICTVISVVLGW